MRFSVIIPAYNAADFLGRALDSVMMQTCKDYEVIVVCDSCTDKTEDICERYGIKPIRINAKNAGSARNAGLKAAKGNYILFLDADDFYITRYTFEALSAHIDAVDPDVLHFGFMYGKNKAHVIRENGEMWCNVWSRVWRRSAIKDIKFSDAKTGEDYEFCKVAFKRDLIHCVYDVPLVQYTYPRKGSLTWEAQHDKSVNK